MEQKLLFIKMWQSGNHTITSLCNRFNISRTTGRKLVKQFLKEGEACFIQNSRVPHSTPHKTPNNIEDDIIKIRNKHND